MEYDYRLKGRGSTLKVKVTAVETWHVVGIRSDNGKEDRFPLNYFKNFFQEIKE